MIPETGQTNPDAFEVEVAEHGRRLAAEAAPVASVEERTEDQPPEIRELAQALRSFGDRIAQAIGDPGSIVGRKRGPSWGVGKDGFSESEETVTRWSTRAVLHVLTEHHVAAPSAEGFSGGAAALRADVATSDAGDFHLTDDQLDALRALLGLVHYDDLAMSWLALLPIEFRSRGDR